MSANQTDRINALGGILRRIGNFDPIEFGDDFNSRLILQKTVYLMQEFGLSRGYYFDMYLHGPYSPSLTRDLYELVKTYSDTVPMKFANTSKEKRFFEFLTFIKPVMKNPKYLEKIASIHFLFSAYPNLDSKKIFDKIKAKIPEITISEFRETKILLRNYGLLEKDD